MTFTILPGTAPDQEPQPREPRERKRRRVSLPRPSVGRLLPLLTTLVAVAAVGVATYGIVQAASVKSSVEDLRRTVAAGQLEQSRLRAQLDGARAQSKQLQAGLNDAQGRTIGNAVAARVLKSVFTVEAGNALGTAFAVRRSADGGTVLVTNYHVVSNVWLSGGRRVVLRQKSRSITGRIDTVRTADDVASITVLPAIPLLKVSTTVPDAGSPVLVVGSPLGLGGTVTTGVVSAQRRHGYVQISAPISPGNSGGPVVNADGKVVGIATLKIVMAGSEGLGFAVPIQTVCKRLLPC